MGQEPILRSTLRAIWLLVPDPFFRHGKALIIAQHNNDCAAKGTGVRQLYSPRQHGATPEVSTAATRFALKGQHRPDINLGRRSSAFADSLAQG